MRATDCSILCHKAVPILQESVALQSLKNLGAPGSKIGFLIEISLVKTFKIFVSVSESRDGVEKAKLQTTVRLKSHNLSHTAVGGIIHTCKLYPCIFNTQFCKWICPFGNPKRRLARLDYDA